MECRNCEVRQRQLYCRTCIKTHLRDFHSQHTHLSSDLKSIVANATASLNNVVEPARLARGRVAEIQFRVEELVAGLATARKDIERKRDRIRKLREDLAQRRRTLGAARMAVRPPSASSSTSSSSASTPTATAMNSPDISSFPSTLAALTSPILAYAAGTLAGTPVTAGPFLSTPNYNPSFPIPTDPSSANSTAPFVYQNTPFGNPYSHSTLTATPIPPSPAMSSLSHTLIRARSGLVQELVEVFNIVEVGGRPPIGGRKGTRGEWTIGPGLVFPVPGDIRRYPPDHINAVLTLTLHFINLLSFYLGVKLPFEIVWTGGKVGLGQPWIGAIKGGPIAENGAGSWARWYTKHPLHLSNSSNAVPVPPVAPLSPSSNADQQSTTTVSHADSGHRRIPSHNDPVPSPLKTRQESAPPQTSSTTASGSGSSSRSSTPTPTRRTSIFGSATALAAGVVGYATGGGRSRTMSALSNLSGRSTPLSNPELKSTPLGVDVAVGARRPLDVYDESPLGGDEMGFDEEEEELEKARKRALEEEEEREERAERALAESILAAMPLPAAAGLTAGRNERAVPVIKSASASGAGSVMYGTGRPSKASGSIHRSSTSSTGNSNAGSHSKTSSSQPSFTTGLAMLIYNVAYLGHTQGVDIPLNQGGEILSNLWRVCCAGEMGRWAHETSAYAYSIGGAGVVSPTGTTGVGISGPSPSAMERAPSTSSTASPPSNLVVHPPSSSSKPGANPSTNANANVHYLTHLAPPTPASFVMDFGQVLQVISSAHRERAKGVRVVSGRKGVSSFRGDKGDFGFGEGVEEEFVEVGSGGAGPWNSTANLNANAGKGTGRRSGEDEWDLVEGEEDDDGF
ncbi:hypothetical protein FA15DRAFT_672349 [Coprinopsis marcescibilis]|uniref:Autophagy-related protein 14 n=1 Tax=Coprinopsis marcescibilis TaxID=230819 RepID=A0A5C3KP46_COPMA|nr:hypothetical protein FA15DRAFT_672349 [Coprinopsis marcescibilis]